MRCIVAILVAAALGPSLSLACTVFSFQSGGRPYIAKNLDWSTDHGAVILNPRGLEKRAFGLTRFTWVSRYASLTFSQTAVEFPWEGMNEAGVVVTVLQLVGSQPPASSDPRPALNQLQFIQYLLDRSSNLEDAIDNAKKVRVSAPSMVHFFVCDAGGHCGVFENLNGQLVVHEAKDTKSLANNPYLESVLNYRSLREKMSDDQILQTATSQGSLDRAARASAWSTMRVAPERAAQFGFQALTDLAENRPAYRTYWSFVFEPQQGTVHYRTQRAPDIRSLSFKNLSLDCAAGSRMLDINDGSSGDVGGKLVSITTAHIRDLLARDIHLTSEMRAAIESYLPNATRCLSTTSKQLREWRERPL